MTTILNAAIDVFVSEHYTDMFNNDIEYIHKKIMNEECSLEDGYDEFYDDVFIQKLFNTDYSFYEESKDILKRMKANDLIQLVTDFNEWAKDNEFVNIFEEEGKVWCALAYHAVKTNNRIKNEYIDTFKDSYKDYIDTYNYRYTTYSRIPCGICFEHKTLHTGCSCCNGNYVCGNCYINIDIKHRNKCPFCRCTNMIKEFSFESIDADEELKEIKELAMGKIQFGKDYEGRCDCCVQGWGAPNEFGWCNCICSRCDGLYRDCKSNCC
jgi:hypothetical protein